MLGFQDFAGVEKTVTIFDDDLHTSFLSVVGTLADEGYDVDVPQAQYKAIQAYIKSCKPAGVGILAEQNGWGEGPNGPYFVNGGEVISLVNDIVVVDPAIQNTGFFSKAGSLNGWKAEVADRCNGNETLMLMTTLALAAPLFRPCRKEALGINLIGTSGHGKSTSLLTGSSVVGKPAKDGSVRTCRMTPAAFEQAQKAQNDSTQFLDELGEVEPRVLDAILYMSADGTEKGRMEMSGGLRPVKSSSVVTVMTGELSTVAVLNEANIKARTGQIVRIGNVDIGDLCPNGVFPERCGTDDTPDFLDELADARNEHYGWAGPDFIKYLMGDLPNLVKQTKVTVKKFTKSVCQPDGPSGHRRFAQFLGVICAAGHFAYDAEIVPWDKAATNRMMRNVFDAWVTQGELQQLAGAYNSLLREQVTVTYNRGPLKPRSFHSAKRKSRKDRSTSNMPRRPAEGRFSTRKVGVDQ